MERFLSVLRKNRAGGLMLAFGCSGAAALIYEVAWTRQLSLVMGHSVGAATTVLAAFMGGLALGAAIGGRLATRWARPLALQAYAAIELLVALAALLVPVAIRALQPVLAAAYADGEGGAVFAATRFAAVALVVLIPAAAMGATLPLLVRWRVASAEAGGSDTGGLYAANTAGAAIGAAATGFVLLPALGLAGTIRIGIALNIAAALVAVWLARGPAPEVSMPAPARRKKAGKSSSPPAPRDWSWTVAGVAVVASGAASLILQLTWTRILAIALGPTTFAFAAMVTAVIAGIAAGSAIGAGIARRTRSVWPLTVALLAAAVAVLITGASVPRLPLTIAAIVGGAGVDASAVLWRQTGTVALHLMPITTALGLVLPLAVHLTSSDLERVASRVAALYAFNSVAAVAGAIAAGLWVIPQFGLEAALRIAAAILCAAVVAITMLQSLPARRRAVVLAAVAGVAVMTVALPSWDRLLLSSGAYKYAAYLPPAIREPLLGAGTLLYYREGAAGTVSVRRVAGTTSLAIDGKVDASNGGDMLTQKLLAHVPLLMHREARRVGIIGLGSGVTLAGALAHPIASADVMEISPEVVAASAHFQRENRDALRDARTRLLVSDGRTHLGLGRGGYDVLISEPSNPWMAGVAALFTREFFEVARSRLTPDGVMCQWAHTYDISDADLRSIVATFAAVFPHAMLWLVGDGDVLLVGSGAPLAPRLDAMRAPWPQAAGADLSSSGVADADLLLSLFVAQDDALRSYASSAAVQTDDRMALEFSAPFAIYGRSTPGHRERLYALAAGNGLPAASGARHAIGRGTLLLGAEAYREAYDEFARGLDGDPGSQQAADGLIKAAAPIGRLPDAEQHVGRLHAAHPQAAAVSVALSRLRAARGDFAGAVTPVAAVLAREANLRAADQLASIAADTGQEAALGIHVAMLEKQFAGSEPARYYAMMLASLRGQRDRAVAIGESLRTRGGSARALNLLATLYAEAGHADSARRLLRESLAIDPRDAAVYESLGQLDLQAGQAATARDAYAEALTLNPASPSAQQGLLSALVVLKR